MTRSWAAVKMSAAIRFWRTTFRICAVSRCKRRTLCLEPWHEVAVNLARAWMSGWAEVPVFFGEKNRDWPFSPCHAPWSSRFGKLWGLSWGDLQIFPGWDGNLMRDDLPTHRETRPQVRPTNPRALFDAGYAPGERDVFSLPAHSVSQT